MAAQKLSPHDIHRMQILKAQRIPMKQIADHFNTTTPTVKYHTDMVVPLPIPTILLNLELCEKAA